MHQRLMEGGKDVSFERMESVMCPENFFQIRFDFSEALKKIGEKKKGTIDTSQIGGQAEQMNFR